MAQTLGEVGTSEANGLGHSATPARNKKGLVRVSDRSAGVNELEVQADQSGDRLRRRNVKLGRQAVKSVGVGVRDA
jgi:hypothetical protein